MVTVKKQKTEAVEQAWANPLNPEASSDARDEEQIARQRKRAEISMLNQAEKPKQRTN